MSEKSICTTSDSDMDELAGVDGDGDADCQIITRLNTYQTVLKPTLTKIKEAERSGSAFEGQFYSIEQDEEEGDTSEFNHAQEEEVKVQDMIGFPASAISSRDYLKEQSLHLFGTEIECNLSTLSIVKTPKKRMEGQQQQSFTVLDVRLVTKP